ncbi:hypothetical protein SHJG_5886 [Streptomyces hygroscopicus subsp. jinggangensis 5008]|nr:hypothetical protein SHJG_5886 [Streptomyces hygroscopicus subsp. jinggangensis 5008]AGF65311.1 hypothetical protein SHJGH_5648 [Streptomyces hygroscopicus subsp. jinggangensis TL01]
MPSRLLHRHARRPPSPRPADPAAGPVGGSTAGQLPCDDSELCPTPGPRRAGAGFTGGEAGTAVSTRRRTGHGPHRPRRVSRAGPVRRG